jgi:hypothetical protein
MVRSKESGISPGLKYLFLIHGIVSLVFGLLFCFTPLCFADLFRNFGSVNPCTMRLTGAIILAIAVKDWFCFVAKRWDEVRIPVLMEIALTLFATIACLYALLLAWARSEIWGCFVFFPAFFVAWTYFYIKYRK